MMILWCLAILHWNSWGNYNHNKLHRQRQPTALDTGSVFVHQTPTRSWTRSMRLWLCLHVVVFICVSYVPREFRTVENDKEKTPWKHTLCSKYTFLISCTLWILSCPVTCEPRCQVFKTRCDCLTVINDSETHWPRRQGWGLSKLFWSERLRWGSRRLSVLNK